MKTNKSTPTKDKPERQDKWSTIIERNRAEGVSLAQGLWESDAVVAYQLWGRGRKELPKNLPEPDRKKHEGFIDRMQRLVEQDPHRINADDARLSASEREDVRRLQAEHDRLAESREQADLDRRYKEAVIRREERAEANPIADPTISAKQRAEFEEMMDNARRRGSPPHELQWWERAQTRYEDEGKSWPAVADVCIVAADMAIKAKKPDPRCDYLSPTMFRHLIDRLRAPGASRKQIKKDLADNLRSRVQKEVRKAKLASG